MSSEWWELPVKGIDNEIVKMAELRQAQLTKPPGSLGRLEELAIKLAGMQGKVKPELDSIQIVVFAADHGVAELGVSAFPQEVTAEMVKNFSRGGAAISVLAESLGANFKVVNVGTVTELPNLAKVVDARVAAGTKNFIDMPAMTLEELEQAFRVGRAAIEELDRSIDLYIGGEMGIANTTSAAALASALIQVAGDRVVGSGTGVDRVGVANKAKVVNAALEFHLRDCGDEFKSPLEIARRVGGFEIVALAASYIYAAQSGIVVMVDGFISSVAALLAVRLNSEVREWMFFSHRSAEQGHSLVLEELQAEPLLDLGMRLGEGSGAAVAVPLLMQACKLHFNMATFAEAGVAS
ncbi:MAG: nicotinate-nucleotide--dimethylbenzimidazole phosphoribosyltransferase [Thiotrichales bacterium]|nr:nicotinate-nucleotide--dimethylbenzimidazole phosphoribosyltransferase [Thiotrichales bacterium]MBT3614114.1 nicotinate-nucleotide--dimethylbenzimidazole phosphoribosyltransferase [Thiotrichales bacterium]MBT3752797.1 nicotinate-nucleotide--dimethylbenzimidazole phosphoribosyltransferase [Thiotrichales bacterium]MBT3838159.1 nicotinate-nucleotide--dimethylbenzimidazole phosphoribosyltransferase [Thiotrichales bacterium]MBT4151744.1 nicotinate-nucleotide--dimethylbenzimidazole phosphoribosylt